MAPPVQQDLLYGNTNGLLLLILAVAALWDRRGRPRLAAGALGIAAALKLFPLFVVPALLGRRWITAAVMVSVFAASTTASILWLGVSLDGLREEAEANFDFWEASPFNGSLSAIPFHVPAIGKAMSLSSSH